jgi:hypothetical protein
MKEFHKEMLDAITKDWNVQQIENYIAEVEERETLLGEWIKHLKTIRKKKIRKPPVDTGTRGGT